MLPPGLTACPADILKLLQEVTLQAQDIIPDDETYSESCDRFYVVVRRSVD